MGQAGSAIEMKESRRGGGDITSGDSYETRVYKVQFTDDSANSIDARNAVGIPAWGSSLAVYPLAGYAMYAVGKEAYPDPADHNWWYVTVNFKTLKYAVYQPKPAAFVPDTDHKWSIVKSYVPVPYELPVYQDQAGHPILNPLGEVINPPITVVLYDAELNIKFLTDAIDKTNIDACIGATNSGAVGLYVGGVVFTFLADTLLFKNAPSQETFDQDGNKIAECNYQFLYRADGWQEKRPVKSFKQYVGGKVKDIPTDDVVGKRQEPTILKKSGSDWIPADSTYTLVSGDYMVFIKYDSVDFTSLLSELTGV